MGSYPVMAPTDDLWIDGAERANVEAWFDSRIDAFTLPKVCRVGWPNNHSIRMDAFTLPYIFRQSTLWLAMEHRGIASRLCGC
jgi:hypothetical protein